MYSGYLTDVEETKNMMLNPQGKSILFIDEIHRYNKLQQDALLPFVEDGTVILIGATTENPYFEVNKALISLNYFSGSLKGIKSYFDK